VRLLQQHWPQLDLDAELTEAVEWPAANASQRAQLLLHCGASPFQSENNEEGQTLLYRAASGGELMCYCPALLRVLVKHGGDSLLHAKASNGNTVLHAADWMPDHYDVLIELGASLEELNNAGCTVLVCTCSHAHSLTHKQAVCKHVMLACCALQQPCYSLIHDDALQSIACAYSAASS
jgi:hypothetical protein